MLSYEEMVKLMIEDAEKTQKWREEKPCCANCRYYYYEYGCDMCRKNDCIPEWVEDVYEGNCGDWK